LIEEGQSLRVLPPFLIIQSMRFWKFLFFLLFVPCFSGYSQNPPRLTLTEKSIDRGAFPISDGVQAFVFNYKNTGESPLVVSRVIPGCSCVVPEFSTEPLMPGDSASFSVQYTPPHTGRFSQMLTVCSNGEKPVLRVYIRGIVTEAVASPAHFLAF
jgi:hypothetical protein